MNLEVKLFKMELLFSVIQKFIVNCTLKHLMQQYVSQKSKINLHSAKNQNGYMMFEVFMVVKVYTVIFWVMTVCSLVCATFQYHNPEDHNMN
jgi:hypothetical protein